MHVIDDVILAVWIVFWASWLVASVPTKKATRNWAGPVVGARVAVVVAVVLLARSGVLRGHGAVVSDVVLQGVGTALFFAGLGLAIWARVCLGRNWGPPMSEKLDPELITSGPYRRIRHPIYSGLILAMVGTAVAVSWYAVLAIALLGSYFVYSALTEDRIMARRFPEAFPAYRRSTKRLIPFVF